MSVLGRIAKGSSVVVAGEAVTQLCGLVRNIVLARVLGRADFGTAALLAMTVSMFELGGRLSIELCVVQSKDGGDERFMAAAHLVQSVLGLVSGVLIFVTATPIAGFFRVPEAAWALRVLALIPILRGVCHLDAFRMTRTLRYGPTVLIEVLPHIVSTLLVWPLARLWPTYATLVWVLIAKQAASTVASYLVAETPYRWLFDVRIVRAILAFGWPMLASGLLMFGIMQGDRFAVGMVFPISELGAYAVAGSLVLVPAATVLKLSGWIMLPLMSAAREDEQRYATLVLHASQLLALLSGIYAIIAIVTGAPLLMLLFGEKYYQAGILTACLGSAQALRLLRNVPIVSAVARGDTQNLLLSNLLRLSGVAFAFVAASFRAPLVLIAVCAIAGEAIALIGSFWRLSRKQGILPRSYLKPFALAVSFMCVSGVTASATGALFAPWMSLGTAAVLVFGFMGVHFSIFAESRRILLALMREWRQYHYRSSSSEIVPLTRES